MWRGRQVEKVEDLGILGGGCGAPIIMRRLAHRSEGPSRAKQTVSRRLYVGCALEGSKAPLEGFSVSWVRY